MANQETVPDATLEGADSVKAFWFTSPGSAGAAVNSYRIVYAIDTTVTVIDVQGAPNVDVAANAARALATAQVDCQGGGACELPELPAELTG